MTAKEKCLLSDRITKVFALNIAFVIAFWFVPRVAFSVDQLQNIADSVGIAETSGSYGVSVADYNGDGLADFLYSRAWGQEMRLYENLGYGFSEDRRTNFGKSDRLDCQWGDPNQDDLLDFYCSHGAGYGRATKKNQLWIQQPDGTFRDQASQWGVTDPHGRGRRVAWFNYNGDEFPDLFVGNEFPRPDGIPSPNRVFVNQGGNHFTEAVISGLTKELGSRCALAADIDRDGYDDLFICGNRRLYVYRNLGGVGFEEVARALNLASNYTQVDAVDLDGNGHLDLILVDGRMCIRPGTGSWSFGPQQCYSDQVRRTVSVDIDGNGSHDLYLARGGQSPNLPDLLLRNDGSGQFTEVEVGASTVEGTGHRVRLAALDHDNDGREGVLVVNATEHIAGPLEFMNLVGITPPIVHHGTLSGVGDTWQTVVLPRTYANPVVVASVQYDAPPALPVVARVRNAASDRFEVRVQNPGETMITEPYTLHYLVVEAGIYTRAEHGITMEAVRATSTQTSHRDKWSAGNPRSYAQTYTNPVVIGQIMSENDPRWSVFWARGSTPQQVPTAGSLVIGKHVGEDSVITRADELVGYLVIEAGSGTLGSLCFQAGVSTTGIGGIKNAPPYAVPVALAAPTATALVSAAGMKGGDGQWPVLYGTDPLADAALDLAVDEDQIRDTERQHKPEQIAFIIIKGCPGLAW